MSAPPALNSKPNPAQSLYEQAKSAPESAVFVILTLGLLLGLQPLATDLYLPALPQLQQGFGAHVSQAQLTLTGFLLAFGCSQILWGPLSDRLGRRPVLLVSTAGAVGSYLLFALSARFASSAGLAVLLGSRIFAGICGANISVASAAIADVTTPEKRSRGMGLIGMAFGLGFVFGPVIGGLSFKNLGLAGPGLVAAGLCAFNFLPALAILPETRPAGLQIGRAHV